MDRIRLVASDMDATLLDKNSQLPPDFEAAVKALAEKGIRFAAASGRPLYTLEEMFPNLRKEMILIGDNGGAIRWNGENLYTSEMPPEGWRALARKTREVGDVAVLCGLKSAYVERQYQQYDRVMKQFYTRVEYVDDLTAVTEPADKFTIYLPRDNSQEAYDNIYGPACGTEFSVAVAGKNWVDIMNPGVHKGAALAILGEKLSISTAEMMAFGDTYNDAEMLETARYGFLMENGSLPLRQRVPFLAPPHWEYGEMQVLHRLLEQNGMVCPEDFTPAH
mgnify:FL=1